MYGGDDIISGGWMGDIGRMYANLEYRGWVMECVGDDGAGGMMP